MNWTNKHEYKLKGYGSVVFNGGIYPVHLEKVCVSFIIFVIDRLTKHEHYRLGTKLRHPNTSRNKGATFYA
jgi:hypothetical protein